MADFFVLFSVVYTSSDGKFAECQNCTIGVKISPQCKRLIVDMPIRAKGYATWPALVEVYRSKRAELTEREMKLFNLIKTFGRDEDGAVTVDWVVLTAAIVGLGIAVLTTVGGATDDYADEIGNHLSSLGIKTTY